MLQITHNQMAKLQLLIADQFEKNIDNLLSKHLSHRYNLRNKALAKLFIRETLEKAKSKNLTERQGVGKYMTLMFMFGRNLENNPNIFQSQLLKPAKLSTPVIKQVYATTIENLKTQYHTVRPGDTLLQLTFEHDISQQDLLAQNPPLTAPSRLIAGQLIRLNHRLATPPDFAVSNYQITDKNKINAGDFIAIGNEGNVMTVADIAALETIGKKIEDMGTAPIDQVVQPCLADNESPLNEYNLLDAGSIGVIEENNNILSASPTNDGQIGQTTIIEKRQRAETLEHFVNNDWTENQLFSGAHVYNHLSKPICSLDDPACTVEKVVDLLNKYGVHPNQTLAFEPGKGYIGDVDIPGPWGRDQVKSTALYNEQGQQTSVLNVTLKNHALHPGSVERRVVKYKSHLHILTEGTGSGKLGGFNIWLDEMVWDGVDNEVLRRFK